MPRPRKPTAVLQLKGAYKVNPGRARARAGEPIPSGPVGDPPDHLDAAQRSLWSDLATYGMWLTNADRLLLEVVVVLFARFRDGPSDSGLVAKVIAGLSKLGFSPADRGRVQAPGGKVDVDPYAEFSGG